MQKIAKPTFCKAWALLFAVLTLSSRLLACCVVGVNTYPVMAGQNILIIWDEKNKTEHFIRQASFDAKRGDSVGFIAPTPSVPSLGESKADVFEKIQKITQEEAVRRADRQISIGCGASMSGVEVIQTVRVAGYVATTVKADSSADLIKWSKENNYLIGKSIRNWLDFYLQEGWCLTLFKVDQSESGQQLATGVVRMSFKTEQPFSPFYVPDVNYGPFSSQAVSLISDAFYTTEAHGDASLTMNLTSAEWQNILASISIPDIEIKNPKLSLWSFSDFGSDSRGDVYFRKDLNARNVPRWIPSAGVQICIVLFFLYLGPRLLLRVLIPKIKDYMLKRRSV